MRNTERGCCSIQYTTSKCLLKCLTFCLFPVLARIAECSLPESHNASGNYSPCESRRIAECLEIKIVSAVNQICRFASTKKKKPYRKLTVACHRHPTEWSSESSDCSHWSCCLAKPSTWSTIGAVKFSCTGFYGLQRRCSFKLGIFLTTMRRLQSRHRASSADNNSPTSLTQIDHG